MWHYCLSTALLLEGSVSKPVGTMSFTYLLCPLCNFQCPLKFGHSCSSTRFRVHSHQPYFEWMCSAATAGINFSFAEPSRRHDSPYFVNIYHSCMCVFVLFCCWTRPASPKGIIKLTLSNLNLADLSLFPNSASSILKFNLFFSRTSYPSSILYFSPLALFTF